MLNPQDSQDQSSLSPQNIADEKAEEAAEFLKALAHKDRLWILCELVQEEKTVSQLEAVLDFDSLRCPNIWPASDARVS